MNHTETAEMLGNVDIYIIDQILKNGYQPGDLILDAGCGEGRNLKWFYKNDFVFYGVDTNEERLENARIRYPENATHFSLGTIDDLSYDDNTFDHVLCCAVLHFANNEAHFKIMFAQLVRVLKKGGSLFIRTASNIGIENSSTHIQDGIYSIHDGTHRFLVTRALINELVQTHKLTFLEPVKTTNVEDIRAMTTLVLCKL